LLILGKTLAMKRVIITGTTGMIGKGVLLECLDHKGISEVLSIGRNKTGIQHPKLKEIVHQDFSDFSSLRKKLSAYDACFFCMGVSAGGMKKEEYTKMTYGFTMALANLLYEINPKITFNYVSGEGTDSSEKGRAMWARVKGKTENDLINKGFHRVLMFRRGIIIPLRGIKSRTKSYQFAYDYFMWLVKFVKFLAPNSVVNTTQIGLAMINSVIHGYEKNILRPSDIIQLSQKSD